MESYELYDLLRKRTSDKLTEVERSVLDDLYTREETRIQIEQIEFIMRTLDFADPDLAESERDQNWNEIRQHLENTPLFSEHSITNVANKDRIRQMTLAIAACIVILVAAFLWMFRSNVNQVYTTLPGQQETIELSDGSVVMINGASELQVKKKFGRTNRSLELSGEGYFQVAESELPFVVNTNKFRIEVLGTVFNVMDYPSEILAEVKLSEGHIKLSAINDDQMELKAGHSYRLESIDGTIQGTAHQNVSESSWHKGIIKFQKHKLSSVFRELEHYYGISIDDSQFQKKLHYSNTFVNQDIESVLKTIELTAGISISNLSEGKYKVSQ